ncbi:MerR family transcriptional regulator [Pseudoclavibacter endophyticus]|uniref:MerR family transcriptional regulator n=1 Tax=Pseudoclavibacter endophyticus TaxID=1778590 RepID=UPI00166D2ABB|nr:MerR family transcriptional regulator [Pseudoclavibacter endophyticus]GGA72873.1 MerR family transcriptional regulator [Pseudoclavibacter endophyticus]
MSAKARLSIGEFSRLTWLSPKALRLYERRGLLLPDFVDEYTGYRYYRPSQAERARTIALLRRVGMPLERIGAVLGSTGQHRRALIEAYRVETTRAHQRAVVLLDGLAGSLADEETPEDPPSVQSRVVTPRAFISTTLRTTAADLPAHIERSAAGLLDRAGATVDRAQPLMVVYHGEVSWESDGPIEVRVPIVDRAAADGVEPEGMEFYAEVAFAEVQFPTILRFFDAVRDAAARGAYRPSGSPREIYLEGDPFRCQVAQRYIELPN